jgi:hypothetical protein
MAQESQSKAEQQKIQQEGMVAMEKAKIDMEKALKAGVNVSFSAEDLVKYPSAYQYYLQMTGKQEGGAPVQPATAMPNGAQQSANQFGATQPIANSGSPEIPPEMMGDMMEEENTQMPMIVGA